MTRAITALVALFAVKLQACTAFQHSKVQSNRAMNAAPPVRLDWSSAKSATPEIGRFTTKTSRALADAGAGTKVHQDQGLPNLRLTRVINDRDLFARYPLFTGGYEHVGHLVYYNDAPNDLYPETYTFGEGAPDWMYRVPPFRMLDVGDHSMERYVKHAKTWAEAAKAGVADCD